jgi:predicted O-linked N-acetylglucosamine transferase (SPINDLY family)
LSYGRDDGSAIRRRLEAAFDEFHDVRWESDDGVARRIQASGIDILVDLNGHTDGNRLRILARRPAPIQAHFLGYPGTLGAEFIDYLFVDAFVVPRDQAKNYAENLVYLPDSYQVNDRKRPIAERMPTRQEHGLPHAGFVFCCFNQTYKITPALFDIWMALLRDVPASVMWLLRSNETAQDNLCREAERRNVDASRLVFAPRAELPDHLARLRLADLFLDTIPVNAHTTASDALWAGVPVLTCAGRSMAARVAGSLLHATGLPELVTQSLDEYEALARRLASDPEVLRRVRGTLEANRETGPLFDTERFRRHIEAAYEQMWALKQAGEQPRSFAVSPISP